MWRSWVAFCVLITLSAVAQAEDVVLPPIEVVGSPWAETAKEPTSFVTIIPLEQRQKQGDTLADVLAEVPGVNVRRLGGALQPRQILLRGTSAQQVLLTLEGIRLNALSSASFDLAILPDIAIGQAQLLRGAGAMAWGSGAEGGVIELALPQTDTAALSLRLGGGTPGDGTAEISVHTPLDAWQLHGGGSFRKTTGAFDFIDAQDTKHRRANNDGIQGGGFASAHYNRHQSELKLIHLATYSERGAPGPAEFPQNFAHARLEDLLLVSGANAQWHSVIDTPLWLCDIEARLGHRHARQRYQNPTALLGGRQYDSQTLENSLEPHIAFLAELGSSHSLQLALDARYEWLERDLLGSDTLRKDRSVFAVSFGDEVRFWRERFRLFGGFRYETATDGAAWVPRLGFQLSPWPEISLMGNVSRNFRFASFDELYLRTEFMRGNPDLQPELAWHADLGLRLQPWQLWHLEVVGFWIEHQRLILFLPSSALYYSAQNLNGAHSSGLEVASEIKPIPSLTLRAAYTFTNAHLTSPPQNPLPARPTHQFDSRATLHLGPVEGTFSTRYVGQRYLDSFGNRPEPGQWWLGLGLHWRMAPQWLLSGRADNLLNIRNAVDALQQPLPGITFFGSLGWEPLAD